MKCTYVPVSGHWRPKSGISFKGITEMTVLSQTFYKAAFVKENYIVLSKPFFNCVVIYNIIVSKSDALIMNYKF